MSDPRTADDLKRERARDAVRRYKARNRETIRAKSRAYYASPAGQAYRAKYKAENQEKIKARNSAWYRANHVEARAKQNAYQSSPWGRYVAHRANATRREIPFLLTFDEWLAVWRESGHFDERGNGGDRYAMCRYGDAGAYEVGNVYIATNRQNIMDGVRNRKKRHGIALEDARGEDAPDTGNFSGASQEAQGAA